MRTEIGRKNKEFNTGTNDLELPLTTADGDVHQAMSMSEDQDKVLS